MARHNKPPPDIGYWTERDLRQARDWKRAGFTISEIAQALGRDVTHVQIKWEMDAFSLEIKPKIPKNCLSCSQVFDSDGAHNRICDKCRLKQSTSASVIGEYGT
jgi:hypothetical protein